jgi:hypothetical protein
MCYWLDTGFGLLTGFAGLLKLVTTNDYNRFANLDTLRIITTHIKSSQLPSLVVARQRILTMSSSAHVFADLLPIHDLSSTVDSQLVTVRVSVRVTLRLATTPLILTTSNFFQLNTCGHSPSATSSLTRGWVCNLQLLLDLASAVIVESESRGTRDHILLPQIRGSHNLEDQIFVFISPRNRVARLHSQTLGSIFFASYDSQGYGGGIRTRFHTGLNPYLSARPFI